MLYKGATLAQTIPKRVQINMIKKNTNIFFFATSSVADLKNFRFRCERSYCPPVNCILRGTIIPRDPCPWV